MKDWIKLKKFKFKAQLIQSQCRTIAIVPSLRAGLIRVVALIAIVPSLRAGLTIGCSYVIDDILRFDLK